MGKSKVRGKSFKNSKMGGIFLKIFGVAIICMVVPLIICTIISTVLATKGLTSNSEENLQALAKGKVTSLEEYINMQKVLTKSITGNSTVVGALNTFKQTQIINLDAQKKCSEYLTSINEDSGNLYENFFITAGSVGYADCLENSTLHDVSEEIFYQECLEKGEYIGNNISPVTGHPVYVIAYAVKDSKTGEVIGTVNNSIDLAAMSKSVISDDNFDVSLFDLDGNLLASKATDAILNLNVKQLDPKGWETILREKQGYLRYEDTNSNEMIYMGYSVSGNYVCEVAIGEDVFAKQIKSLIISSIIILVVCFAVASVVIFFFAHNISKPLRAANVEVTRLIDDINGGHGDLSTNITVTTKDETGQLVTSINHFIATLNDVISSVRNTSGRVQTNAISTNNIISEASESSMNISAVMQELTASMDQVSSSTGSITDDTEKVLSTVKSVSEESDKGARLVDEIKKRASDIKTVTVNNKQEIERNVSDRKKNLDEAIIASKKVDEIQSLTNEILEIASQTNLLALNASIEAARAGEAGKGFAVVADEIRQLADSSRNTANNIQTISEGVVTAVNDLMKAANDMMDMVATTVMKDYDSFEHAADVYYMDADHIENIINVYNKGMNDLQKIVASVTEAIKVVSTAVGECSVGVSEATENVNVLVDSMAAIKSGADKDLSDINELQDEISKFS